MKKSWRILGAAAALAAAFLLAACSSDVDEGTPDNNRTAELDTTTYPEKFGSETVYTATEDSNTVTVTFKTDGSLTVNGGSGPKSGTYAVDSADSATKGQVLIDGALYEFTIDSSSGALTLEATIGTDGTLTADETGTTLTKSNDEEPTPEPDTPVVSDGEATVTGNDSATGTQVKSAALSVSSGKLTGKLTLGNGSVVDITEADVSGLSADGGTFEITANNVTYSATYTIADGKLTISQITGGEAESTSVVSDGEVTYTNEEKSILYEVKSASLSVKDGKLTGTIYADACNIVINEVDVSNLDPNGGTFKVTGYFDYTTGQDTYSYTATYRIDNNKLIIVSFTDGSKS